MSSSEYSDSDYSGSESENFSSSGGESDFEEPKKKTTSKEKPAPKKPAAKITKKAPAKRSAKKSASSSSKKSKTSDDEDEDFSGQSSSDSENVFKNITNSVKKEGKTLEEIYQKKELLDQILLRPDTYIGSTEKQDEELWVWENDRMVRRKLSFVPGIYKIFDEILVNAADNKQRDTVMKYIKVEIDPVNGKISVTNDGACIPVQVHKEHKVYIPELIFGHLLTSSHYDDSEKRLTGGRNGFGAKLANIFSTKFIVECADVESKKLFRQTFTNNMRNKEEPKITSYSNKTGYTKITFYPELSRFGMVSFDDDLIALLSKRVYDIAGCNNTLKVTLNDKDISMKSFEKYVNLYFNPDSEEHPKVYYEKCSDRWEIAVTLSTEGSFQQVSFVNSICTVKGGTHVTHALSKVITEITEQVTKKHKGTEIKPAFIKNHLFVFVNSLIENPHFDSQTKETLTSKITSFGSRCEPSEKFLKKIIDSKSGIISTILAFVEFKDQQTIKNQNRGGKKGRVFHSKLDDATNAGSSKSADCTLILTEGDSAKTLAIAGISIVGKDHYGAFPLKGKLLNVREQGQKALKNSEISNIMMILGLQPFIKYEDVSKLRYGHLMIMTDQDHDGSHIKGLIINFFHHFWPQLLHMPGFLVEFITPIVKVFKNGKNPISFYTLPEFLAWREKNPKGWDIKYYKGLGTSQASEGKAYFSQLDKHKIDFEWDDNADTSIELAFSKSKADERKKWMAEHVEGTFLKQYGVGKLTYTDFINKELILFSIADCERSIPSIVDGLKTSQRKILFSCFKRNLKKEIKVAQLIGYVSEHSAYHHGEMSLYSTILGMTQEYVGSNNVNVLFPSGAHGTRIQGGKDASSARYIFTRLNNTARAIYHPDDDNVLSCVVDDGKKVQPKHYIPVIPMILVNGTVGIGTGWSCTIPNYNPRDLVENMRRCLKKEPMKQIQPWYRGFKGEIVESGKPGQFFSKGVWQKIGEHKIHITELPINQWTQDYREFLDELESPGIKKKRKEEEEKKKGKKESKSKTTKSKKTKGDDDDEKSLKDPIIKGYVNNSTDSAIDFVVETIQPVDSIQIEKVFKLTSNINETNMVVFDEEGRIQRFANTQLIQEHFFNLRMKYYQKRKDYLSERLSEEHKKLNNKARFILAVINKEIVISNVKKVDIMKKLKEMGFDLIYNISIDKIIKERLKKKAGVFDEEAAAQSDEEEDEGEKEEKDEDGTKKSDDEKGYDYLLSMPLWTLTMERVKKVIAERDQKKKEWDVLLGTSLADFYYRDLDQVEKELDAQDDYDASLDKESNELKKKSKSKVLLPRAKKISQKQLKEIKETGVTALSKPIVTASGVATSTATTTGKRKKSDDTTSTTTSTKSTNTIDSYFSKSSEPSTSSSSTTSTTTTTTNTNTSNNSNTVSLLDDSFDDLPDTIITKKPSPTISGKKAAAKKKTDEIVLSDDEEEVSPPKKLKSSKKPSPTISSKPTTTKKPTAPKKKKDESSDEESDGISDDDDNIPPPTINRTSRARPTGKIILPFLESSDEESMSD